MGGALDAAKIGPPFSKVIEEMGEDKTGTITQPG